MMSLLTVYVSLSSMFFCHVVFGFSCKCLEPRFTDTKIKSSIVESQLIILARVFVKSSITHGIKRLEAIHGSFRSFTFKGISVNPIRLRTGGRNLSLSVWRIKPLCNKWVLKNRAFAWWCWLLSYLLLGVCYR